MYSIRTEIRSRMTYRICCALATLAFCQSAAAQNAATYAGEVSVIDAYGNARPGSSHRRAIGAGANYYQRQQTLAGYQSEYVGVDRRSARSGFALQGFPGRAPRRLHAPFPTFERYGSPAIRGLYERYGGFGTRVTGVAGVDVQDVFARRDDLIQASSLNAPVHRARLAHGTAGIGIPVSRGGLDFVRPEIPSPHEDLTSLEDRLRTGLDLAHKRLTEDAWEWFRNGREDSANYRRASRAFESLVMLDEHNMEARIGEMFSVLSVGAYRTAIVLLAEIARRDTAPFTHRLDMGKKYGDPAQARQVRMLCESFTQASAGAGTAVAVQAFVLWYVGDREQAILTAEPLATKHANTNFADWAAQMRAAMPMWENALE